MYNLWYNYLKKQYGKKIRLLYTDTDSLKVEAETDNYKDIHEHEEDYVLVNIQRTIPIIIKKNKRVFSKFKDKHKGRIIRNSVFIRPKINSYKEVSAIEIAEAKGVSWTKVKKGFRQERYKECIDNDKQFKHEEVYISSHNHQMRVYKLS